MDKSAPIEGYLGRKTQISTILKLFEPHQADNITVKGERAFEVCPKCGKVHPVIVKCIRNEVGLNRINSDHSVIKSYYRQYSGVASRYINRHASMFAYVRKLKGMSRLSALSGSMASYLPERNSGTAGYTLRMI